MTEPLPGFRKVIMMPAAGKALRFTIVLRYYSPYGEEWKEKITPATVSFAGKNYEMYLDYAGSNAIQYDESYLKGQVNNGYDQYAHYFYHQNIPLDNDREMPLIIHGQFQRFGYFSIVVYMTNDGGAINEKEYILEFKDFELTSPEKPNPYIQGNKSVFFYDKPEVNPEILESKDNFMAPLNLKDAALGPYRKPESGEVFLFRSDKNSLNAGEDVASDGCSRAYLTGFPLKDERDSVYNFIILRIKVPETFVHQSPPLLPDLTFGKYECRYVSVNSTVILGHPATPSFDKLLDFWTVNSTMLEETKDSEGYSYVFFAPVDYVESLINENHPRFTPPKITWGKYSGYMLGLPTNAIIVRYRAPDPLWEGSPERLPCYVYPWDNQPVNSFSDYLSIYSDTGDNFKRGIIGNVSNVSDWPES